MNKPVAWQVAEMVFTIEESAIEMAKVYGDEIIPLYTHPVKELTEDEIDKIERQYLTFDDSLGCGTIMGTYEFAKAILKKAQEK